MSSPQHWFFPLRIFCKNDPLHGHQVSQNIPSHFTASARESHSQDHWVDLSLAEPGQTGLFWNPSRRFSPFNGDRCFLPNHRAENVAKVLSGVRWTMTLLKIRRPEDFLLILGLRFTKCLSFFFFPQYYLCDRFSRGHEQSQPQGQRQGLMRP